MKETLVVVIVNLILLFKNGNCHFNPCPQIQFCSDGNENSGIITIPSPGEGVTKLEVKLAIRDPVGSKSSLALLKNAQDVVADVQKGQDIQYRIKFPQSSELPYVNQITLNNRNICNGIERVITSIHIITTHHTLKIPAYATELSHIPYDKLNSSSTGDASPPSPQLGICPSLGHPEQRYKDSTRWADFSWLKSLPFEGTCGRALVASQLIIGGTIVTEGEYPWMVAMFHQENSSYKYKCGGSLISNIYVITAAHCTEKQDQVYLHLGQYDITNPNEANYINRTSKKIIRHQEYKIGQAHADIALIEIDHVEFTQWIKPICLWANFDTKLLRGTVTGWGQLDNDETLTKTPMQLNVSMVGLETCRKSQTVLRNIVTNKTFCAGGESSGPCHGDSGGGFYVIHGDVWYLRGIISTSLGTGWTCDVDEYAVYADLAYYLDWIRPYLLP